MKPFPRAKAFLTLLACIFFVPVLGVLTARYMASEFENQFHESIVTTQHLTTEEDYQARHLSYASVCENIEKSGKTAQANEMCSPAEQVALVNHASYALATLGALMLLLIYGGRAVAGASRARLSLVFGFVVRAVMLLLAVSVLGQAALLVFSVYTVESMAIQRVHGVLLGSIGLAALVACWKLIRSTFELFKDNPLFVKAIRLDRGDHPELFAFVDDIATRLGARTPANIIAGLEPNFFVTAGPVALFGQNGTLANETLFVSLGMMRLFSKEEFAAVVGHELGHFRGEDVVYSKRFAPTYARLGKAWMAMSGQSGNAAELARLPAVVTLGTCWNVFASAERAIGRDREMLADTAGAEASDATSLATALVKVSTYASQWGALTKAHIDQLAEGRTFENLSTTYRDGCESALAATDWNAVRAELGKATQPHPVDTHPPLAQRLNELGMSLDAITAQDIGLPEDAAIQLLHTPESVEKQLSELEAQWLVAIRAVVVPQRSADANEVVTR